MRRGLILALAGCMVLTSGAIAHAGVAIEKVVPGTGQNYWPSSNGTFVAYSQYLRHRYNALAMNEATGLKMTANINATFGVMGSFVQGSTRFVYQQYSDESNLFFFDVATGRRTPGPPVINKVGWVYWPQASQDFILFMRATHNFDVRALFLYDRSTNTQRKLVPDIGGKRLFPGFVGARYAAWTLCGSKACSVYVYDSTNEVVSKLPTPDGESSYSPVIDEATDLIYFVQSPAQRCGIDVTIRSAVLGTEESTIVAALPRGIDTGATLSLTANTSGFNDMYFERWDCKEQESDVVAIRSVDDPGAMRGQVVGPAAAGSYAHPVARPMPTAGAEPPR